jgi:hypothetical protein
VCFAPRCNATGNWTWLTRLFPQTLRTTIKGDDGLGYFEDGKKIGEVQREIA